MFDKRYWDTAKIPAAILLFLSVASSFYTVIYYSVFSWGMMRSCIFTLLKNALIYQLLAALSGDLLCSAIKNSRFAVWLNYGLWYAVVFVEVLFFYILI